MPADVAVVVDQPILLDALAAIITEAGFRVRLACTREAQLLEALGVVQPDLVVLHIASDPEPTLHALEVLRHAQSGARVLAIGRDVRPGLATLILQRGASALLELRETRRVDLVDALHAAARGETRLTADAIDRLGGLGAAPPTRADCDALRSLTARQRDVLSAVSSGFDNLKISAILQISERTVKGHVCELYRKLGVENRVELALMARTLGVRSLTAAVP